ncbi:MAG: phage holin family protein [Solirubrobacteraceae bacterium]
MPATDDHNSAKAIAEAVNEISERASLLVREEIELAKAEVSEKMSRLVKGAVVGGAAAVFAIFGIVQLFHGFSWLAWWALPFGETQYFWGFFVVAAVLFVLGGLAGLFAAKLIKKGAPPMPQMAIDEAKKTRAELSS